MGSMMTSFCEGMSLGSKAGLEQSALLEILGLGAIANPMFALKGPAIMAHAYPPAFPLKHQQKDLRLALALGEQLGQPLPVAAAANEAFKVGRLSGTAGLLLLLLLLGGRCSQAEARRGPPLLAGKGYAGLGWVGGARMPPACLLRGCTCVNWSALHCCFIEPRRRRAPRATGTPTFQLCTRPCTSDCVWAAAAAAARAPRQSCTPRCQQQGVRSLERCVAVLAFPF